MLTENVTLPLLMNRIIVRFNGHYPRGNPLNTHTQAHCRPSPLHIHVHVCMCSNASTGHTPTATAVIATELGVVTETVYV